MNRTHGFTLIELLTVIAIIGILTAIAFPVFARMKDTAYRGSDTSNLNALRTALSLYRTDQGGYPPAILGYASLYETGVGAGNVIPANQAISFLYPRRVDSMEVFRPAYDAVQNFLFTTAVWPNQDSRAIGSAPYLDLNGDGVLDSNDDTANTRQAFGPSTQVTRIFTSDDYCQGLSQNQNQLAGGESPTTGCPAPSPWSMTIPSYFYKISGFDVATVTNPDGTVRNEIHYAPFWTVWGLGGGNAHDDPRQLGYTEPPESTVVTWDSYFREYTNNSIAPHTVRDIVLFLGGGAKAAGSEQVYTQSWRVTP